MITVYSNTISVTTAGSLLLDDYPNAAAAYSLRKLRGPYIGDAIRVRRASDNTELNIGFVNNELDTATLESFCSGTDGFVTTWYDQSGNGRNATQTTAANQPQIVISGSVILENGKPTIYAISLNFLLFPFGLSSNVLYDTFAVVKNNPVATAGVLFGSEANTDYALLAQSGSGGIIFNSSSNNSTHINATPYTFTNRGDLYNELTSQTLVNLNANYSFVGTSIRNSYQGATFASMYINQELIMYSTSQSTNRIGIETNINSYYDIY